MGANSQVPSLPGKLYLNEIDKLGGYESISLRYNFTGNDGTWLFAPIFNREGFLGLVLGEIFFLFWVDPGWIVSLHGIKVLY